MSDNQRVSNYQTRLYIYGDDTVVRDSLKSTMGIEEKTYTALIGGITVIEFEDFREAKNTGNGQEIMAVSYTHLFRKKEVMPYAKEKQNSMCR